MADLLYFKHPFLQKLNEDEGFLEDSFGYAAPGAAPLEFPETLGGWATRMGVAEGEFMHIYVDFSSLPVEDVTGSGDDIDEDNSAGVIELNQPWNGRGGGVCVENTGDAGGNISTTATGIFAVGTNLWTLHYTYHRGTSADAFNEGVFSISDSGAAGFRIFERVGGGSNWIFPSLRNQALTSRSIIIQDGPSLDADVDVTLSRTSATTLELWASDDGGETVYHENLTIAGTDNYDSSDPLRLLQAIGAANSEIGCAIRAIVLREGGAVADDHDAYRGTERTSIVEA